MHDRDDSRPASPADPPAVDDSFWDADHPAAEVTDAHRDEARGLCAFVDASPSPFHVCGEVVRVLSAHGFRVLDESDRWPRDPGRYVVVRGGSVVAWSGESATDAAAAARVVGAHTDSPTLRVKQRPDLRRAGWHLVGLEPYGGPLLNSWLDRDLGISGRVALVVDGRTRTELVRIDRPLLRVPQLAIHLSEDRSSLQLDRQRHLDAVWAAGSAPGRSFAAEVADELGTPPSSLRGWELMVHDVSPSRLVGRHEELVSAPRLDNQGSCYAGLRAFVDACDAPTPEVRPVLALFDHEEVGSTSDRGANSSFLSAVLERIVWLAGGDREDYWRAIAGSVLASADMSHATHPNYAERHEPQHGIQVNGGPVLKVNQNLRYATDAVGSGVFSRACDQAGVPLQRYVHRADLPCGSTIGPMSAARAGIQTVDVGAPQLAMHSARELMGAADVATYVAALRAFLAPQAGADLAAR